MKALNVGLYSSLGMLVVGGLVFAVTPAGGFNATPEKSAENTRDESDASDGRTGDATVEAKGAEGATFSVAGTLKLEGRLGHASLKAASPEETFMLLEVSGTDAGKGAAPPVALSLVIDRSGSMKGTRHQNALQAAAGAIERLHDGDTVSVVAFDTRTETIVPSTTINASTRQNILASVRAIQLGGDTCISCGIEGGLAELAKASGSNGSIVKRMIVLSDGDTNNGIRDVPGFRSLAQRSMGQGVNITTIGVDLEFNEKIMSAIAQASNGRHYFVENDRDLARVFDAEAASLTESVANDAVAEIELAQGVEVVRVFDRTFTRSGSRISVPLGSVAKGETKTVLVKVRLPKSDKGSLSVASAKLAYRDLVENKDSSQSGKLAVELVDDSGQVSPFDSVVLDRVQRSETGAALREANSLFSVGKADEARKRLEQQQRAVNAARPAAAKTAPSGRAKDVDESLAKQEAELNRAIDNFKASPSEPGASPAPPAPAQKSQVKRSVEQADALAN